MGNASADNAHTMLVFIDYQCPYCADSRNLTRAALALYPKLAMEWRHVPRASMAYARRAALSAECAGDEGKFWELSDLMLDGQQNLSANAVERMAQAAGVQNITRFDTCVASAWHQDVLDADLQEAEKWKVGATPTYVIGNTTFKGAVDKSGFMRFVDNAMAASR